MKRKYTSVLSFSKEEIGGKAELSLANAGFSTGNVIDVSKLERPKQLESLGFLSGADGNAFFPDLKASDLAPKPEDFVTENFRLLSATIVAGGSWRATDFSDEKVLKASVGLLARKPMYYNHNTDPLDWVGIVDSTSWGAGYTAEDGTKVPGGINGVVAIDAKTNPKLARGVLAKIIYSNSVTVLFDWEPSHEFADEYSFMNAVGSVAKDGRMVTRKVTKIYDYHESSLVYLGADPFAKMIDESGQLHNVDTSSVVSLSKELQDKVADLFTQGKYEAEKNAALKELYDKERKYEATACLSKNVVLSLSKTTETQNLTNPKVPAMNPQLFALLLSVFGLPADTTQESLTKEQIDAFSAKIPKPNQKVIDTEALTALQADSTSLAEIKPKLETAEASVLTLTKEKETLDTKVKELEPLAKVGEQFVEHKRSELVRLYSLGMDGKPDQAVLDLFKEAKPDAMDGLLNQYTKGVTAKFGGKCKKCDSTEFEFRSTVSAETEPKVEPVVEAISFADLHSKFDRTDLKVRTN
jgi:hypothetical protein